MCDHSANVFSLITSLNLNWWNGETYVQQETKCYLFQMKRHINWPVTNCADTSMRRVSLHESIALTIPKCLLHCLFSLHGLVRLCVVIVCLLGCAGVHVCVYVQVSSVACGCSLWPAWTLRHFVVKHVFECLGCFVRCSVLICLHLAFTAPQVRCNKMGLSNETVLD